MAQFDVHRSPARNRTVPFAVVIQSRIFDDLPTRLVAPLAGAAEFRRATPRFTPVFTIDGRNVVLLAWQIQTVRAAALRPPIESLADGAPSGAIINAIDTVISRAHG